MASSWIQKFWVASSFWTACFRSFQSICIEFAQHMLQNITFTLFNPSFVEWHVLSIAVLLHDPVCFFFFLQAHPDILEFCSINQMNRPTKDRQTRPTNHDSNSTVRFRWDEIQMLECCLFISSNVVFMIYTKQFQCLFSNKQQMSSCVLLEDQWHSPFNHDMDNIFVQCSADGGLKNMSVSQCERPLVSEKHVTRGYFVTSSTITHFALWGIFVSQVFPGRVTMVLNFSFFFCTMSVSLYREYSIASLMSITSLFLRSSEISFV